MITCAWKGVMWKYDKLKKIKKLVHICSLLYLLHIRFVRHTRRPQNVINHLCFAPATLPSAQGDHPLSALSSTSSPGGFWSSSFLFAFWFPRKSYIAIIAAITNSIIVAQTFSFCALRILPWWCPLATGSTTWWMKERVIPCRVFCCK